MASSLSTAEFDPKSFEPNYKQCAVQLHSETVPEGITYDEVEISGYLEGVKVYEEKVLVEEKIESAKK